jgi:hypothetical protein
VRRAGEIKVPERLWRVPRAAPQGVSPPLGHRQDSSCTLPLASRGRVCLRKGCGRIYQPSRWNQRYCGDSECRRLVRRWQAAKRQQQRRRRPEVRQQQAAAEQRRRACRQQEGCQSRRQTAEDRAWSRSRKKSAAFCDRPGCYEPCRGSCRCQARYCGDDCRQAMRRVRDRERKHLGRKTISGRLKRRLEYQARGAPRRAAAPGTAARPPSWASLAVPKTVGDYRNVADSSLSSAAPVEEPADDPKTSADSRPRASPSP